MGPRKAICEVRDEGEGVLILDSVQIEASIILNRSQLAVSLLDEEEGGCVGRLGWLDVSLCILFLDEFLQCLVFCWCHWVYLARYGIWCVGFEFNCVVPGS